MVTSLANLSDIELNALIQAEGIDELDESQLMDGLKGEDVFKIDNINTDAIQQYLLEELDEDLLKDLI